MSPATQTTSAIIEQLFAELDPRQKKVLTKRYGLDNGEEMTLAELGKLFNVTRERIRQIEALAINEVKKRAKNGHIDSIVKAAVDKLKTTGGVRKESHLLEDIKHFSETKDLATSFANHVRFLLELSKDVMYHREDNQLFSHWHLSAIHQKRALDFLEHLVKHLKERKHETLHDKRFHEFFGDVMKLHKMEEKVADHYLSISKKFSKNMYGDFGLTDWEEVNPKVSRDWIYLVLQKAGRPLHFSEIAEEIRKIRQVKMTNTQTIHNELIKDKRFILVGRGIYGLRELDQLPSGTIRDILVYILKAEGPMKAKDIITKVLKHRIFKENTILFNLQNKKYFERSASGEYMVKSK